LPAYLLTCRWFGGKAQPIRSLKNIDVIPFSADSVPAYLTTWEVQYVGGSPETYVLPLAFAAGDRAFELRQGNSQAVVAYLKIKLENSDQEGILYDALYDANFCKILLDSIGRNRSFKTKQRKCVLWLRNFSKSSR
jgi:maltose alpha-D-glucosyltransferase/alpha-amylase